MQSIVMNIWLGYGMITNFSYGFQNIQFMFLVHFVESSANISIHTDYVKLYRKVGNWPWY